MAKVKLGKKEQSVTVREQNLSNEKEQLKASVKTEKKSKPGFLKKFFRPIAVPFKWINRHLVPKYIRNAFGELRNITWPQRKLSRQLTTAVMLFAIVFAIVVSALDYGLDKVFKKVFLHE
jgi:preprotein translocase SecE subunit